MWDAMIWLEFELIYFEAAVEHFSHYATGTSSILRSVEYIFIYITPSFTLTYFSSTWQGTSYCFCSIGIFLNL